MAKQSNKTRVYNVISVPEIIQHLSGHAIISSNRDLVNGSKKEKRSFSKVSNSKTMLTILSFIRILHLKQQYFFRLEFGKTLFSNKFFSCIFRSKMTVHTIEKDQIKYFAHS